MQHLENSVIDEILFNIPYYKRYVDDIFILLPYDKIESTLKIVISFFGELRNKNLGHLSKLNQILYT